jgi:hypothetical protein
MPQSQRQPTRGRATLVQREIRAEGCLLYVSCPRQLRDVEIGSCIGCECYRGLSSQWERGPRVQCRIRDAVGA